MAMTILNNTTAMMTLGELNKNVSRVGKDLKKLSSGMKVNSAGDDASAYAISERMRVQIRGLEQDLMNSRNGRSLLRTAEGAVDSTVSILRTMKAKAIDAANDTNTDIDRATIQKELNQSIDQLDDNALVTYNGKYLLTGEYKKSSLSDLEQTIINAMDTEWVHSAISLVRESFGFAFGDTSSTCNELHVAFAGNDKSTEPVWLETTEDDNGDTTSMTLFINTDYYKNMSLADVNGDPQLKNGTIGRKLDRALTEGIAQAALAANWKQGGIDAGADSYSQAAEWQTKGLAAMVTGIDDEEKERLREIADAMYGDGDIDGRNVLIPLKDTLMHRQTRYNSGDGARAGGYFLLRFMMHVGDTDDRLPFFPNNVKVTVTDSAEAAHFFTGTYSWDGHPPVTSGDDFLRVARINLDNEDTGALTGSDVGHTNKTKTATNVVPEEISVGSWDEPDGPTSLIDGLTVIWPDMRPQNGLKIQTGTRANQNLTVFLPNMRAAALGVSTADGTRVSVATREKATAAIDIVDAALGKALNTQTTIGAYQQELEYTEANLTTASENVQKSESTIRDADMAQEMMSYTKNNVLAQASQSMLAQANQTAGNVLSLLQ